MRGFEVEPPPSAMTPLCLCNRPAVWVRGCWLCSRRVGGCDLRLLELPRPEPVPVAVREIQREICQHTAALLSAVAVGKEAEVFRTRGLLPHEGATATGARARKSATMRATRSCAPCARWR